MDSLLNAAARALASGDPIAALKHVALRDDPPSLALRGIALAQLGELARARVLLRRASKGFGPRELVARARCTVAAAEVAFAARELAGSAQPLRLAARTLDAHGDSANALHARLLAVRRWLLLGKLEQAERELSGCALQTAPPRLLAIAELVAAELALRHTHARTARAALERAAHAAERAGIVALAVEISRALHALALPAARVWKAGEQHALTLEQVEDVLAGDGLVVDGRSRIVREREREIALTTRPVLFALLRVLAEAWPADVARDELVMRVFAARRVNDSHRARLRVELGRLRAVLRPLAGVNATARGYVLAPHAHTVIVLAAAIEGASGALLALLADGAAWSTSALALALGAGQRTVQRALVALEAEAHVHAFGRGRAQRWLARPVSGFTTSLLLPATLAPH